VNVVAREETLETQGPMLRSFMRAYLESIQYFKTHRNEAVRKIMALSRLSDRQIGETVYETSLKSLPDDGRPTLRGMEVVLEAAAKENPKARSLAVQQIVDLRFLQ
jgi:predicted solute-binding protein